MSARRNADGKRFLNKRELAALLGKSVRTVEDWRYGRTGPGPPWVLIGGEAAYDIDDVERWLKSRRRTA